MEHSQRLSMLGTRPLMHWETKNRLFGQQPRYAPTLDQQEQLIRQLDYWRSLGFNEFKRLTSLNMTTHQQPIYQIGELPLDMLFMTFMNLRPQAAEMNLHQVQQYWLNRFRSNGYVPTAIRCCIEQHSDHSYHWHILVKLDRTHLFHINHLRIPRNLGPNSFILPVYDWQAALKYLEKDGQFISWHITDPSELMEQEHEDFDSAPPPFFEAPLRQQSLPLEELPTTAMELINLFRFGSFDNFAKIMRKINQRNGIKGPDCFTLIERRLKK